MVENPGNNKAQLGCGTLIIIAIIVMLFSGGRESKKLQNQLEEMNRKLDRLEQRLDALSDRVTAPAQTPPAR